jgi:riboflavin kinase/FMN adenylyltransferase
VNKRRWRLEVVAGKGRGRRIGVPTLNLAVPDGFDLRPGIYACRVWLADDREEGRPASMGALHYGPVPTFGEKASSLEVHLVDRKLTSPPERIELEVAAYLRPVAVFPDVESLVRQIEKDIGQIRRLFGKSGRPGRV